MNSAVASKTSQPGIQDPFTLGIIRNAILAASEEMFLVTARTAMSPIIYDVLDFSTAIHDHTGDVIAQAVAVPAFIGMLDFNVRAILKKYTTARIEPGDVFILNDPYLSGSHLNDVTLVAPIHHEGELMGFTSSKGHWNDVGGMNFGSFGPGRTEIFQEGLQIPPSKLYRAGERNDDLVELIQCNSRLPQVAVCDMEAQVAGMRAAAQRVAEIITKYGIEQYRQSVQSIFESGSRIALERLAQLPKGEFHSEDMLDEGGPEDGPLPVHVKVEISDTTFKVDFSGNPPQLLTSINTTFPGTVAAVRIVYMALVARQEPYNQGLVAPLEVIAPEGTVFNALRPAPTSVYWETLTFAADLIWKALAPHIPEFLSAGHFLSVMSDIVAGVRDDNGEPFALVEPNPGGWGASEKQDGESALVCFADGETYATSVEVIESRYPIQVDRYEYNVESGFGHGKHRGGLGIIKDYRILNEHAEFTTDINRSVSQPWGVHGGGPGSSNVMVVEREGKEIMRGRKVLALPLERNDVISIRSGGGGGWGSPLERDPELILRDVEDGYLADHGAGNVYGVVFQTAADGKMTVDTEATLALRQRLAS